MFRSLIVFSLLLALAAGSADAKCTGQDVWPNLNSKIKKRMNAAAARDAFSDGRFFRVTKNGKTSYLFGTMHSPPKGKLRLPPIVTNELRNSNVLFVEVTDAAELKFFSDKQTLLTEYFSKKPTGFYKHFSADEWRIITLLYNAHGLPKKLLPYARPWYLNLIASSIGCGPPPGRQKIMDARLEQIARNARIKIGGLEKPAQSMAAMQGFSSRDYSRMIKTEFYSVGKRQPGDMYYTSLNMYHRGEIQKILYWQMLQYAGAPDRKGPVLIRKLLQDQMLVRRNKAWMPTIYKAFAKGGAFVAVGALHLGGKGGILPQLQRRGFQITRLKFIYK